MFIIPQEPEGPKLGVLSTFPKKFIKIPLIIFFTPFAKIQANASKPFLAVHTCTLNITPM